MAAAGRAAGPQRAYAYAAGDVRYECDAKIGPEGVLCAVCTSLQIVRDKEISQAQEATALVFSRGRTKSGGPFAGRRFFVPKRERRHEISFGF